MADANNSNLLKTQIGICRITEVVFCTFGFILCLITRTVPELAMPLYLGVALVGILYSLPTWFLRLFHAYDIRYSKIAFAFETFMNLAMTLLGLVSMAQMIRYGDGDSSQLQAVVAFCFIYSIAYIADLVFVVMSGSGMVDKLRLKWDKQKEFGHPQSSKRSSGTSEVL